MQQLSRSFQGYGDSWYFDISRYIDISIFQITSNFSFEQILICNPGPCAKLGNIEGDPTCFWTEIFGNWVGERGKQRRSLARRRWPPLNWISKWMDEYIQCSGLRFCCLHWLDSRTFFQHIRSQSVLFLACMFSVESFWFSDSQHCLFDPEVVR